VNGARIVAIASSLLLAACASAPPPGPTLANAAALDAAVVPGQSTSASVAAALGAARVQRFDNGYQVWQYRLARPGGQYGEVVILIGPDGVVRKLRRREPTPGERD